LSPFFFLQTKKLDAFALIFVLLKEWIPNFLRLLSTRRLAALGLLIHTIPVQASFPTSHLPATTKVLFSLFASTFFLKSLTSLFYKNLNIGGFGTLLMAKDMSLAVAAAQDVGATVTLGAVSGQMYKQIGSQKEFSKKDFSAVYKWLNQDKLK
jgi:hypothetical protein